MVRTVCGGQRNVEPVEWRGLVWTKYDRLKLKGGQMVTVTTKFYGRVIQSSVVWVLKMIALIIIPSVEYCLWSQTEKVLSCMYRRGTKCEVELRHIYPVACEIWSWMLGMKIRSKPWGSQFFLKNPHKEGIEGKYFAHVFVHLFSISKSCLARQKSHLGVNILTSWQCTASAMLIQFLQLLVWTTRGYAEDPVSFCQKWSICQKSLSNSGFDMCRESTHSSTSGREWE